jgi:hypothetical protein
LDARRALRRIAALLSGIGFAHDAEARRAHWVAAWGTSPQGLSTSVVTNETARMIVRPTATGAFVRVRLENAFGASALTVGAASIPAGGGVTTDALPFAARAWEDVAISLYLPGTAVPVSRHGNARKKSFLTAQGAGDHTADESSVAFTSTTTEMWLVAALDVFTEAKGATTTDGHDRWHDIGLPADAAGIEE